MDSASLRSLEWRPIYSHEDGNLADIFFTPALARSCLYQRVTGYFSASVFALAARGLDALMARGGYMQLIVGCTLGQREIRQIQEGYKLRDILETSLPERLGLDIREPGIREKLGWLSWMIANRFLDIKLAVPKDRHGRFTPGLGLYHAKSGILTDESGDRLVFTGSLNETESGWIHNWESFSVSCAWRGEWDLRRVEEAVRVFEMLWANQAASAEVVDIPRALRESASTRITVQKGLRLTFPKNKIPECRVG